MNLDPSNGPDPAGSVLGPVLPPTVALVERFADEPGAVLLPAEEAAVARAVAKRRNEFATVRHCARLALATLGIAPVALVPGPRGASTWPAGVVGSMTHCDGYRAAAVARIGDVRGLGIDAEPHAPLPDGVLRLVAQPAERRHLDALAAAVPAIAWDRILFSAKESIYKAWYPLAQEWLGFEDAEVTFDPAGRTFDATIGRTPANGAVFPDVRGRWTVAGPLVATVLLLEANGTPVTDRGTGTGVYCRR